MAVHPPPQLLRRLLHVVGPVPDQPGLLGEVPPTIVGPLLMTFLLTCGSGQRLTERRMADRPQYADYIARTQRLHPSPAETAQGHRRLTAPYTAVSKATIPRFREFMGSTSAGSTSRKDSSRRPRSLFPDQASKTPHPPPLPTRTAPGAPPSSMNVTLDPKRVRSESHIHPISPLSWGRRPAISPFWGLPDWLHPTPAETECRRLRAPQPVAHQAPALRARCLYGVPQAQVRGEGPEVRLLRAVDRTRRRWRNRRAARSARSAVARRAVGLDPVHQVGAPRPVEFAADPAVRVLQRVGVAAAAGLVRHRGQEQVRYETMVWSRGAVRAAATTRPADR